MFNQQGWRVGVVVNDPDAEIIRLRELLNEAEARERRLREACEMAMDWICRVGEHSVVFGGEAELYEQLRAALVEENDHESR